MELMTEQEIHEFGLQVLTEYLLKNKYDIELVQPQKDALPSIVAKLNDKLVLIAAATGVYPHKGVVTDTDKTLLIEHADKMGAQAACAYLGLLNAAGVAAKDKFLCGQALKGAQFYADFGGLEFIHFED